MDDLIELNSVLDEFYHTVSRVKSSSFVTTVRLKKFDGFILYFKVF